MPDGENAVPKRRFSNKPEVRPGLRVQAFRSYEYLDALGERRIGRCVGCGFLSRRSVAEAQAYWTSSDVSTVERVSIEERSHSEALLHLANGQPAMPWCYAGAAHLPREFDDAVEIQRERWAKNENKPPERLYESFAMRDVLDRDRRCGRWVAYLDPQTPAQHLEQYMLQQLEDERARREERLSAMEIAVAERSEAIQRDSFKIAEALRDVAIKADRFQSLWTKIAVTLALAVLLLGILAYVFPDAGPALGRWIVSLFQPSSNPAISWTVQT